jgi:Bacterial Ig-like domain
LSNPIQVQLVPDITPPVLVSENISEGAIVGQSFRAFMFEFSRPIDATTVTASSFRLIGPDGAPVDPASIQLRLGDREVQVTYNQLALGQYQYQIDAPMVLDTAGIALAAGVLSTDFTVQPFSAEWTNPNGGSWNTASN